VAAIVAATAINPVDLSRISNPALAGISHQTTRPHKWLYDEASESRATVAIWLHRLILVWPMSALGQKQTCAAQNVMSALPPKADIRQQNVR
jgi:hypothetical protein